MQARLNDLGEEVNDGCTDGVHETIDDGGGVERYDVGRSSGGFDDRTRGFDVESDDAT